ncbi:MAG: ABC transporter permease, partial [Acidobacteriaceae bacterium]
MIFRRLFHRSRRDRDLASEIAAHMNEERAENLARGLSPEQAERRARIKFGPPRRVHEDLWQQNSLAPFENLTRDLRYTIRTLGRTPGFTLTAILVMALGIGATTALFTVVRSVLLNPLPYPQSSRLVSLYESDTISHSPTPWDPVAGGVFHAWQNATRNSAQMALVSPWQGYNVSAHGGQLPESISAAWVSWNLFRVLGVAPALGRDFLASDDQPNAQATAILSNAFWKRRFGADPAIIGKSVYLDAKPHTIIGVMSPSFAWNFNAKTQLWTAVAHEAPPDLMSTVGDHEFMVVARLAPGATLAGVVSQIDTVQRNVKLAHPEASVHNRAIGRSLLDATVEDFRTPLYALLAATLCVLLIACLNLANLLVARSAARQRDFAIRAALGGTRWRLIREHLTESLVLSIVGGAFGLLLAAAALSWLQHSKINIARGQEVHLDWWSLAFILAISTITGLVAGLIPSLGLHAGQLLESLQSSSRSHSGRGRAQLRKTLLTVEVGLTVVLLLGAGLLLKSYQRLRTRDLGCAVKNVLTMQFSLPDAHYSEPTQKVAFFEQLLAKVRGL